jgi:hypothetical protein
MKVATGKFGVRICSGARIRRAIEIHISPETGFCEFQPETEKSGRPSFSR